MPYMPKVDFIRKDLQDILSHYETIRDCVSGEKQVKFRKTKYLPKPNAADTSSENEERYKSYVERAVFYNVTKRTLGGLVGQIFTREPQIEIPALLDPVKADATGSGVPVEQLAKKASGFVVSQGRCGLLIDYPVTNGPASRAQIDAGYIRPTFSVYAPWEVINWRTIARGGKEMLSLVVVSEQYCVSDDGFEMKMGQQYRVMRLVEASQAVATVEGTGFQIVVDPNSGLYDDELTVTVPLVYQVEVWRKGTNQAWQLVQGYPAFPKDAGGTNLDEIPFIFIGAENNDPNIDNPPMYDLASLNIAHYRNSADYEEACFIVGQPTPYFAGLTEQWVKSVLKGTIQLGARAAVPLPEGGTAGLLQAEANTMPKEAMEAKERQMVALGAKLVEQKTVQRTATEADLENTSETSTLSASAKNVSAAFQWAFEWAAVFVGAPEAGIKFELNTEFDLMKMSPEERKQLLSEWQGQAITFGEMRTNLRRAGIATLDDAEAQTTIADEAATQLELDAEAAAKMNAAVTDPNAPPKPPPNA